MLPLASYWSDTSLGEVLGSDLSPWQIQHLVGFLLCTLFGLSAIRHGRRAEGWLPAVWGTVAIGLLTGSLYLAGRGFPEYLPLEILPYLGPDSLTRAACVLALLLWAAVFLLAYWVNGSLTQWWHRLVGLALLGVAVWLATGWFAEEIPDEAKPWTARTALVRLGTLAGLLLLAVAFWRRGMWASDHLRWLNRALAPAALAAALFLGLNWFGLPTNDYITRGELQQLVQLLGTTAVLTCLAIAVGAWFLRTRPAPPTTSTPPRQPPPSPTPTQPTSPAPTVSKPLPVALLLDAHGRPIPPPR